MALGTLDVLQDGTFAIRWPAYVDAKALAATTAESFAVPSNASHAIFSATGDFYVSYTTTATVPGDTADGTACELNPTIRFIAGVTTISVIAPATTILTIAYYRS